MFKTTIVLIFFLNFSLKRIEQISEQESNHLQGETRNLTITIARQSMHNLRQGCQIFSCKSYLSNDVYHRLTKFLRRFNPRGSRNFGVPKIFRQSRMIFLQSLFEELVLSATPTYCMEFLLECWRPQSPCFLSS